MVHLYQCLACEHAGMNVQFMMTFCWGNGCGIKYLSQQRAVTWTVCDDARRRGSGRPLGPCGSPSTGNSSTSTLLGRTMSWARVWASQQNYQDTVWRDRCWWAGNVVSLVLYFRFYSLTKHVKDQRSHHSARCHLLLEILILFISQEQIQPLLLHLTQGSNGSDYTHSRLT